MRNLTLLLVCGLLSAGAYAADAVSGATAKAPASSAMSENVDAVTSASVVPAAHR